MKQFVKYLTNLTRYGTSFVHFGGYKTINRIWLVSCCVSSVPDYIFVKKNTKILLKSVLTSSK